MRNRGLQSPSGMRDKCQNALADGLMRVEDNGHDAKPSGFAESSCPVGPWIAFDWAKPFYGARHCMEKAARWEQSL